MKPSTWRHDTDYENKTQPTFLQIKSVQVTWDMTVWDTLSIMFLQYENSGTNFLGVDLKMILCYILLKPWRSWNFTVTQLECCRYVQGEDDLFPASDHQTQNEGNDGVGSHPAIVWQ
jgi:hypothetical protein